jgi:Mn2+/Fe2+ NRAMP family transporter
MINGIIAAPVMGLMMLLASNRKVVGRLILPVYLKVLGWAGAAAMALAAIGVFVTAGK